MVFLMHGEYKVPGGKLVVADVTVADGRLTTVRISGDFFLEPPEVLNDIDRALEGMPADASETMFSQAIDSLLPANTRMFGFSSTAVAIAVTRALS
jgi:hypothetical protein